MQPTMRRLSQLGCTILSLTACHNALEGNRVGGETGTVLDAVPEDVHLQLSGVSLDPQALLTLEQLDPNSATSLDDARWRPLATVQLRGESTSSALAVESLEDPPESHFQLEMGELTLSLSAREPTALTWTWTLSGADNPAVREGWQESGVSWYRVLENGVPLLALDADSLPCESDVELCQPSGERFGLVDAVSDVAASSLWLSRGQRSLSASGLSHLEAAERYYEAVEAGPGKARFTLEGWKVINGFPERELTAHYYNGADLGFGRDMHCRTLSELSPPGFACYVTNYGDPTLPMERSLELLLAGQNPVATVTMEYRPADLLNPVRFYAYGAAGERLLQLALDSQGAKPFPGICVSCHGGTFEPEQGRIEGAHFLPFDVGLLGFSGQSGKQQADQQEVLRQLNLGVLSTPVSEGIRATVAGMYAPARPTQTKAEAASQYVTAGWQTHPTLYQEVVRPYCQGCHQALQEGLQLQSPDELLKLRGAVLSSLCSTREMPHAELTSQHFWASGARAFLLDAFQVSNPCRPE